MPLRPLKDITTHITPQSSDKFVTVTADGQARLLPASYLNNLVTVSGSGGGGSTTTAITQAADNNSTLIATTAYADRAALNAVANRVTTATLAGYVTSGALTSALSSYPTSASLSSTLSGYVTSGALTSALASYVSSSSLTSTLSNYVSATSLSTTLGNYVTSANLTSTLGNYALSSNLSGYVSNSSLTTTLQNYPTNSVLASTLSGYATTSSLNSYVQSSALANYVTNSSLATTLNTHATDAEVASLLLGYVPLSTAKDVPAIHNFTNGAKFSGGKIVITTTKPNAVADSTDIWFSPTYNLAFQSIGTSFYSLTEYNHRISILNSSNPTTAYVPADYFTADLQIYLDMISVTWTNYTAYAAGTTQWHVDVYGITATNTETVFKTITLVPPAAGVWSKVKEAVSVVIPTNVYTLALRTRRLGTPGGLTFSAQVTFRAYIA